jgi:phosphoribosyl 1,2-cyclic phosphodiesterase
MAKAFSVFSLASGSSGNSFLVKSESGNMLIDAGIGIRTLTAYLKQCGVLPEDISAIVLTHEHGDHAACAHAFSKRYRIPLIANAKTLARVYNKKAETDHVALPTGGRHILGEFAVETFPVPHDAADPVGVNITHNRRNHKICLMTDAGYVSDIMREAARGAHLMILEANHDVHRLLKGPYPGELKARILGDRGHLSNEAAVGLLCEHALRHGPFTAWLAHLSKENNTPKLALGYAKATVKVETGCPVAIDVAKRDIPSAIWRPESKPVQLNLF